MNQIKFQSGVVIDQPVARLERFLSDEYAWYDGITDRDPHNLLPEDVLAAVGMNAFIGRSSVGSLRGVQRGLAERCVPHLWRLPPSGELATTDDLEALIDTIVAGTYVKNALSAVVTKVLHRKRRQLIPILDKVMVGVYCSKQEASVMEGSNASEARLREVLRAALLAVQADLRAADVELRQLAGLCAVRGWTVSPLRVHDILVWSEHEEAGYYR